MAVRTYLDTSLLIAAFRGSAEISKIALSFLEDPLREYVISDYLKLELLPKCVYHKQREEYEFYETYFKGAVIHVPITSGLVAYALDEGMRTGISGMDAIHVACAVAAEVKELITAEKPEKPLHRATEVKVISILT